MIRAKWDWRRARDEDFCAGYLAGAEGKDRAVSVNGTGYECGGYEIGRAEFERRQRMFETFKPKPFEPLKYDSSTPINPFKKK